MATANFRGRDRGMYISVYPEKVEVKKEKEDTTAKAVSAKKVRDKSVILNDTKSMDNPLEFIKQQSINSLSMYLKNFKDGKRKIFGNKTCEDLLRSFMKKARSENVKYFWAIGEKLSTLYPRVHSFNETDEQFYGLLTEFEFWKVNKEDDKAKQREEVRKKFRELIKDLQKVKQLKSDKSLKVGVYIGYLNHLNEDDVKELIGLTDYLFVHCYAKNPEKAYKNHEDRFILLNQVCAQKELNVIPMFSAEGNEFSSCGCGNKSCEEHFMGDWFHEQSTEGQNAIEEAEKAFESHWNKSGPTNLKLDGFQYFTYEYLSMYLKNEMKTE